MAKRNKKNRTIKQTPTGEYSGDDIASFIVDDSGNIIQPESDTEQSDTEQSNTETEAEREEREYNEQREQIEREREAVLRDVDMPQEEREEALNRLDTLEYYLDIARDARNGTSTQPDTDQPDTDQPDTDQPDTDQPDTDQPDTDQPDTDQPDTDQPDTDQPDTDQPDTDQPDTDQPDTDQPDTDQPDTDQPDTDQPDQQVPNLASAAEILKEHPEYIPRMSMYIDQIVNHGGDQELKKKWADILSQFDIEDTLNSWNNRSNSQNGGNNSAGGNGSSGGSYNGAHPGEGYNDWLGKNGTFRQMYGEPVIQQKERRYWLNNIGLPIGSTASYTVGKSLGDYKSILGDAMHAMAGMDTKQADTYSQQAAKLNQNMMTGSMIDPGAYYSSLARNKIDDASDKIKQGSQLMANGAVANDIASGIGKALKDTAIVNNAKDDAARNAQLMINEHPVGDYYRYLNGNESRTHRDLSQGGAQ